MSNPITIFFDSWKLLESTDRHSQISSAVTLDMQYNDPRSPDTVSGVDAINEYVGMFSANAPGWSATVVNTDTTAGMTRATVSFGGPGPDGEEMAQLGQYFVEITDGKISRMIGFVGIGVPQG